jgi:phenylacetate-CoA ligase
MRILEISRKYAFWFLDFIRQGKIRKHYNDIELVLNHASSNEALKCQEQNLSSLLRHAVNTTRFYESKKNFKSFNDFPVINKSIIRESFNYFISNKFEESELKPIITSGSTGTPFKVYHDKNKRLRNSADTIFFARMAGYDLGDRLVYLKVWVKQNKKSPLNYWIENIIPVDVSGLNDVIIEGLIRQIENRRATYHILGYASALESICKYLEKRNYGRVKADVKSVIAMSETLNDFTKRTMNKYFNAPVVSRYSNIENGIIAQQETTGSDKFLINTASYVVEILKMDSDEQSEPGQTGRIVITDLFNYAMPMIRYDTGDIGAISYSSSNTGNMYFSKVEGRKLDMLYDAGGNFVSSYIITAIMMQYTEILQFQFIQEGPKQYTMKINADGFFTKETILIQELKAHLGQDVILTIQYVQEIPLLSSGKRKIVINKCLHAS